MKIHIQLRDPRYSRKQLFLVWAQRFFFLVACLTLGFSALVYFEAGLYQAFETRQFEKVEKVARQASIDAPRPTLERDDPGAVAHIEMPDGSPISKMEIPRLGVSVVVVEGVKPRSLRLAVGHIPGTALPGERGNIGIAGHRDTFFHKLQDIREVDLITLTTPGRSYLYFVESAQIVDPTDVQVLQSSNEPILTLVTCYPFYFAGPAPQRYIVRARQMAILSPEVDRFTTVSHSQP
jgi:sortase A